MISYVIVSPIRICRQTQNTQQAVALMRLPTIYKIW